jgi:chromosome partition protein MukB
MHESHSVPGFMFSIGQIAATEILLVGYTLFPCARLEVHPRLTILSGNNAVGKTTILDALQTVILCHQRYINLNVASGQNDRNLAGQIKDRVAWAVLGITGHESVKAIGVRLIRKPASDQVDLEPFALAHVDPEPPFFLDPASMLITSDLQELRRRVVMTDMAGQVREFAKLDEYHDFLHQEGIFPIHLLQKGMKRLYSGLWRQITQPKLGDLQKFLREMLCTAPRRKMGFDQVEQLMRERRKVEQRLDLLLKFKATREELQGLCERYVEERRSALSLSVALHTSFLQGTRVQIQDAEGRSAALETRKNELNSREQELSKAITTLENELAKLHGRQSELQERLRHHRDYVEACLTMDTAAQELLIIEPHLERKKKELEQAFHRKEELQSRKNELELRRAQQQERLEARRKEAQRWKEYLGRIEEAERQTGWTLRTKAEIGAGRERAEREKRHVDDLPNLKKQAGEALKRAEAHEKARHEWGKVLLMCRVERATAPTLELLHSIRTREEERRQDSKERIKELEAVIQQRTAEKELLLRGRPPLPDKAVQAVDRGMAVPLADRFEGVDLPEAKRWQQRLGPLALAIEPGPGVSPADLGTGVEPFWIYTGKSPASEPSWKEPQEVDGGSIGGVGDLSWYQPDGPVWLSSKARVLRIRELEQALESDAREKQAAQDILAEAQSTVDAVLAFVPLLEAFDDRDAPMRFSGMASRIQELEEKRPEILRRARFMTELDRDVFLLDWSAAPEQVAELEKLLQSISHDLEGIGLELERLSGAMRLLEKDKRDKEAQCSALLGQLRLAEERKSLLEKEEPLEVLLGRVDFQEAEELERSVRELQEDKGRQGMARDLLNKELGGIERERLSLTKDLDSLAQREKRDAAELESALREWQFIYPDVAPPKPVESPTHALVERSGARREFQRQVLGKRIEQVASEHGIQVNLAIEPDESAALLLESMMPHGVDLDREEEHLGQLRAELKGIETRIRTYVEEIKRNVDVDLNELGRRVHQVNRILSDLSFGRIRRVQLDREFLPAYDGLKKLKGQQLTLFSHGESISLQQFVQQVRDMVARYARTEEISEEQIADYRTYVRIRWTITDAEGSTRDAGFSSGEGLGINLAICLSLLFYLSGGSDRSKVQGMLLMALDEAERLDEKALLTVRSLLDRVNCQLLVALPRTLEVPSSLCHMLTPLPQGVTHISVYHEG